MAQGNLGPGNYLIILLFVFAYSFILFFSRPLFYFIVIIVFFYNDGEILITFIMFFLLVRTSLKETESICQLINK